MRRLLRASIFVAAAAAIAPLVATGCSYVNPPALSIAASSSTEPYFTLSSEDLLKKADELQSKSAATKGKPYYNTTAIAEYLTTTVNEQIQKQLLAEHHATVTDADSQLASQILQQSGQQATQDQTASQAEIVALSRTLGEEAFASGAIDKDQKSHELYEAKKSQLQQPAQSCWHVIVVAPAADPNATSLTPPTDAELAKAQAAKARLATESFETVADDVSALKGQAPGGDLGCQDESKLPAEAVTAVAALPVNAVSDPIKLSDSYAIIRVDNRKPASTPTFDEVKSQVELAVVQQEGAKLLTEAHKKALEATVVVVDPRFGSWDLATRTVNPPPGSSDPTLPTTTTTAFDPTQFGQNLPGLDQTGGAPTASIPEPSTTVATSSGTAPASSGSAAAGGSTTTTVATGATSTTRASTTTTSAGGAPTP